MSTKVNDLRTNLMFNDSKEELKTILVYDALTGSGAESNLKGSSAESNLKGSGAESSLKGSRYETQVSIPMPVPETKSISTSMASNKLKSNSTSKPSKNKLYYTLASYTSASDAKDGHQY